MFLSFFKDSGCNSITHNATVIANGLAHFGATSDIFLRENLDWLKRASNWAKFTATASLGVIHYVSSYTKLNELSSWIYMYIVQVDTTCASLPTLLLGA